MTTIPLSQLHSEIKLCTSCTLCEAMPFKPVTGIGPSNASIMIVGEAPGEDESIAEEPFIGQAGMMLNKLLQGAGLNRNDLYIANLVNCRPTEGKRNRPPTKAEINACNQWLISQILAVRPKVIFTLGKLPTFNLLGLKTTAKLHDYIGKESEWKRGDFQCKIIPNLHPSYVMQYGKKEVQLTSDIFKIGLKYVK